MNLRDRLNAQFRTPSNPVSRPVDPAESPGATRARLDRLFQPGRNETGEPEATRDPLPIEAALPGEVVSTPAGPVYRIERRMPLTTGWGQVRLGDVCGLDAGALIGLGRDRRFGVLAAGQLRFLDTETTGLAGGTGTYPFLIGGARVEEDDLVVTQWLLREFSEEAAALRLFGDWLAPPCGLVTFNGKSFDLPLLETRRVMNRVDGGWLELPHFDLLHPARRIWKMRLARCPLTRLERVVLGYERENDIDGALIPQVYFDYQRTGDARELARVVEHNRLDIVSMVALLAHAVKLYGAPHEHADQLPAPDLFSLGKLHHGDGNRTLGRDCMETAVRSGLEDVQEAAALHQMARAHRQAGEHERAAEVWQRLTQIAPEDPVAYIELAKHHEHNTGDWAAALTWVEKALRTPAGEDPDGQAALAHRAARLRRKQTGERAPRSRRRATEE